MRPSWAGQLQPMQEQSEQHSDDKIITFGWKGKMRRHACQLVLPLSLPKTSDWTVNDK